MVINMTILKLNTTAIRSPSVSSALNMVSFGSNLEITFKDTAAENAMQKRLVSD